MAGSVNKVILVGNLGRDPEIRYSQDGTKIVTLSVATSENWKDRSSGERREKTEWHRVVIFNPSLAELAERYLRKGSKMYLEGALHTRKWTDPSGGERTTTEVVIGRFRGELALLDSRTGVVGDQQRLSSSLTFPYDTPLDTTLAGLNVNNDIGKNVSDRKESSSAVAKNMNDISNTDSNNNSWDRPPDLDDEIPF